MTLPWMSQQCGGNVGPSSDSWLDPNFWDRNKLYFLDSTAVLTSRNTATRLPRCVRPDLPRNLEWSGPCRQQASQCMRALSWLQSNYRSLIMGPIGQNFLRSFGKPIIHESQSLTPSSCLSSKSSKMTYCQKKSTKISTTAALTTGLRVWNHEMWTHDFS